MSDERYRKVPTGRLSRFSAFGQIAGGVAGGMIAEGAKRLARGERPLASSVAPSAAKSSKAAETAARGPPARSPMKSSSFRALTRCVFAPRPPLVFRRQQGGIVAPEGIVRLYHSFGLYRSARVLGLYRACQRRPLGEVGLSEELCEIRRSCGFDAQVSRHQRSV
jgi:hypothetical protein